MKTSANQCLWPVLLALISGNALAQMVPPTPLWPTARLTSFACRPRRPAVPPAPCPLIAASSCFSNWPWGPTTTCGPCARKPMRWGNATIKHATGPADTRFSGTQAIGTEQLSGLTRYRLAEPTRSRSSLTGNGMQTYKGASQKTE